MFGILVFASFTIAVPQAWAQAPSPEPACVGDACKTNLPKRIEDKNTVLPPFKNCAAARKAGAAPVLRGHPGYGPHLDTDGDGIGCEDGRLQITPSLLANSMLDTETPSNFVYYKNCRAAFDAGAAPVLRGDPGYAPHLDRDNDGIGCEFEPKY